VEEVTGDPLWKAQGCPKERALAERVAILITDTPSADRARMTAFGEGSVLQLDRPAAVKTGTTTDWRDNWTVGYTPDLAVGVWAGNADNSPMQGVSGISGAAPIWHEFVRAALKGEPARPFSQPEGLVTVEICALSGLRAGTDCPHRRPEIFIAGTEPQQPCDWHRAVRIDRATGLPAEPGTPAARIVERVYTLLPPELAGWGRAQGIEPPPAAAMDRPVNLSENPGSGAIARAAQPAAPVVLTHPDAGTIYRISPRLPAGEQRIAVEARPGGGAKLSAVTLLVDGAPIATLAHPPYRALWTLMPGEHRFQAVAKDASGRAVESDATVVTVLE
jgi:membrane carboxypeptidase/penicillin-binding protein PbpC